MLNSRFWVLFGLAVSSTLTLITVSPAMLLQGGISEEVRPEPATLTLVDSGTGQPLHHAKLQWPQLGKQLVGQASATLPPSCYQGKGCFVAASAEGYEPKTLWLLTQPSQSHTLALAPQQRSLTWIDDTLRLGDGAYSWQSAGAHRMVQQGLPPKPKLQLNLPLPAKLKQQAQQQPTVWLELGEVYGLDTPEAYQAGQSQAPVAASPLRVKLNQQLVGSIHLNQRDKRLEVPSAWLLRAGDTVSLTLEAGYQSKPTGEVDFDDCSVVFVRWAW